MHVGRIAHAANRYVSDPPVAPSVVRAAGQMWTDALGMQDLDTPRALDTSDIPGVTAQYAQATTNALAAGFDGVELHSARVTSPCSFCPPAAIGAPMATVEACTTAYGLSSRRWKR